MIAHRCELKSGSDSNYMRLATYILNKQGNEYRICEPPRFTNVQSEGESFALKEIVLTQEMNTRAKGDKTYHLVISFQDGENPPFETLKKIEDEICKALGYAEHQRLSLIHRDTDNLHVHVAINKIHPAKFTMHEPYYDKKTLMKTCETLEKKYGLRVDNHTPKNNQGMANAMSMERAGGMESLVGWIQRNCLEDMRRAESWEQLQEIMGKNGLEIKEKGRGLVLTDGNIGVKASTVSREFSKASLESRLGPFRSSGMKKKDVERKYEKKPMPWRSAAGRIDSKQLYEEYKRESQHNWTANQDFLNKAKRRMSRKIESANATYSVQKTMLAVAGNSVFKKVLNSIFQGSKKSKIKAAKQEYQRIKNQVFGQTRKLSWHDWLKREAKNGNEEALAYLQSRRINTPDGNQIDGNIKSGKTPDPLGVTSKGSKVFPGNVRETEQIVAVPEDWSNASVLQALKVATEKFAGNLEVHGSDEFKRAAVQISVSENMDIRFSDPEMEKMRKEETTKNSAKKYIENRNKLRFKVNDVLEHRLFSPEDAGEKIFAGIRTQDGASMALFKSGSIMLVVPLTGEKIPLKKGDVVNVNKNGKIELKTRRVKGR